MQRNPAGLILCAALIAAPLTARSQGSLEACAEINDDAQRLTCYDRLAGRAMQGPASPTFAAPAEPPPGAAAPSTAAAPAGVVASAAATKPAVAKDPVADFGLSEQAIKERAPEEYVERIAGRVTNVGLAPSDRYVITLDNGQVWEQSERNPRAILAPGDTVTIKRAALGSFKLSGPRSVYWRVQRLK